MPLPPLLADLLTAHGPSGYEAAPAAAWRRHAEPFAAVATDVMGSSTATVLGTSGGLRVAVIGHIDEIGLIVTHVDDKGFLWFAGVGGWDPQILVGQRVALTTRDGQIPGVVGRKPIHLLKDEARKKVPELRELHIDIGARDGDEARELVRVGDVAVIAADPIELPNGRFAVALDGQPAWLLRRARGGAPRRRGRRRRRRCRRRRRGPGGDHDSAAPGRRRSASSPTSRSSSTSRTPPTCRASRSASSAATISAAGR